jgi:hypothetical protein
MQLLAVGMTSAERLLIQIKKIQQVPKHPDEMTFIWDEQGRSDVVRKFKHPTKRTDSFSAESRDQHQNVGDVGNRIVHANVRTIVTYRCRTASINLKLSIQHLENIDFSLHSLP